MSFSRRAFLLAALTTAASTAVEAKDGRKQAAVPEPAKVVSSCSADQKAQRFRADIIFELKSGQVISSNLEPEVIATKQFHPASLSKLEGVREIFRRIAAGIWKPDTQFSIKEPKKAAFSLPLRDVVLAAMNPSANVIDSIADHDFIRSMQDNMRKLGMLNSTYVSATGNPVTVEVRQQQRTTVADLIKSIRSFELDVAAEAVSEKILGLRRITGLWKVDIPHLTRQHHTIKILESADPKEKGRPMPGVVSGKSCYTCEAGFGSYVRYHHQGQDYIVMTLGHETALARDDHTVSMINAALPEFIKRAAGANETTQSLKPSLASGS